MPTNSTQKKRGRPRKSVNDAPPNVPVNNDTVQTPPTTRVNSRTQSRTVSDVSRPLLTRARLRESQRVDRQTEEPEDWAEQESEDESLSSPPPSSPPTPPAPTRRPTVHYTSIQTTELTNRQPTATQSTSDSQCQTTDAVRTRRHPLPIVHPRTVAVSSARHAVRSAPRAISPVPPQFRTREVPPPSPSVTPVENRYRGRSDVPRQALSTARQVVSDARRPPPSRGSLVPTVFHSRTRPLSPDPSGASRGTSVSTPEDRGRPRKLIRLDEGREGLRRIDPNVWTKVTIPSSSSMEQISEYSNDIPLSQERNSSYQGRGASGGGSSEGQEQQEDRSDEENSIVNGRPRRSLSYTYLRGLERTVFNGTVNDLRDDALFKEPFPAPDRIDQIFEDTWLEVCRAYDYRAIPIRKEVLANLKQRHSTSRGTMTQGIERFIYTTFGFHGRSAIYIRDRVEYLLQSDRYICHPTKYDVCGWRFAAPAIRELIQSKYYDGKRQRGLVDPKFMDKINDVFMALAASVIGFGLRNWATGEWTSGREFKRDTCFAMFQRHLHSFNKLPILNQDRLFDNLKVALTKRLARNGKRAPERTEAYTDPAADDFLDFKAVSSDEEEVESDVRRPQKHGGENRFEGEIEETQDAEVFEGESDDDEL